MANTRINDSVLSLEREQVKRLTPSVLSAPLIPGIAKAAPLGISSSLGSVQISSAQKSPLFRPQIEPPQETTLNVETEVDDLIRNVGLLFARLQIRHDEITALEVELFDLIAQQDVEKLKILNERVKTAILEHIKSVKEEKKWGIWETVIQYFVAASSLVFGVALIATGIGVVAGALLVAAGGLGLVNRIMTDTGGWKALLEYCTHNKETAEKIANRIQTGMFLLSLGMSLAGGAMALQTDGISDIATLDRALKALALTGTVMNAAVELVKGVIKKRSSDIKAQIIRLTGESTDLRYKITSDSSRIDEAQKVTQENLRIIKEAIRQLEVTSD